MNLVNILQAGETWISNDCTSKCTCHHGDNYDCEPYMCHQYAECDVRDGVRGCYCNNNYEGDGLNCVRGKNTLGMYLLIEIILSVHV